MKRSLKQHRKTRKAKKRIGGKRARNTRVNRRKGQKGGDGSWKIPTYSTVIWRDRRDDPYSPPIVTTKGEQEEMTEYD